MHPVCNNENVNYICVKNKEEVEDLLKNRSNYQSNIIIIDYINLITSITGVDTKSIFLKLKEFASITKSIIWTSLNSSQNQNNFPVDLVVYN
jgi:archaellum biogenesis ATPase FlaH